MAIAISIFIALKDEFTSYKLFILYSKSPRNLLGYILLIQFIGCYTIYMIGNAILEFKNKPISFKVLYIISGLIIVILNALMIVDFISSDDKISRIRQDYWADALALIALFFTITDFFSFFIKKKGEPKNKNSHRYNTDDYKDIIPDS